jgi:putative RNA 2'-phosphotransferase
MHNGDKSLSKFLSLILRHKPQTIGLTLDEGGWAHVEELILKTNQHHVPLTLENLKRIVAHNDKKRFLFSNDQQLIRANQGHSIEVDLQLKKVEPPQILYHGTAIQHLESIKVEGLQKRARHHVHLSADLQTAKTVGARYGKPVVLRILSKDMHDRGFHFFQSENGVWLTECVPPEFLEFENSLCNE